MVRKIVHDWVSGSRYAQFHFVFWFTFQDLNTIEGKMSLSTMVHNSYPHFGKKLEDVWDSPESLLFILDGLDQFKVKVDFRDEERSAGSEPRCLDPERVCEVADIVRCLVRGTMLKGCSVLLTSRPEALETLRQAQLDMWTDIFFDENSEDYVRCCFNDEKSVALKRAKETDIFYTMGFDPSGDRTISKSLAPVFTPLEGNPQLPQTTTQLFSNFICNVLKDGRCLGGQEAAREALLQTGRAVYEAGWKPCTVFTEDHRDLISGLLMKILEMDEGAESCVYTLHRLAFREYLAALGQYLTSDPSEVAALLDQASSDCSFHPFIHFLIGLSAHMSRWLEDLVGPLCPETSSQVSAWLRKELETRSHHLDDVSSKRDLMDLFHSLSESQDVELMRQTMRSIEALNFGDTYPEEALSLSVVDCFVLARIMEPCDIVGEMYFSNCSVQAEGIQRLVPMLHKCTTLNLWGNNLGDSGVKRLSAALRNPECHIQKLCLSSNGLTVACIEDLVSALSVNQSLTELFLDYNNLGDSGVKGLAVALRNSECKIQNLG
uniref:NACHT domain-containing protein n=1 Tax=Callorhinchus milii TaxID=7868 RepID=A0A4W3IM09_CALMI